MGVGALFARLKRLICFGVKKPIEAWIMIGRHRKYTNVEGRATLNRIGSDGGGCGQV